MLPLKLFLWVARRLGYTIILYPDHFGHQAGDVEYDFRTIKGKILYIAGQVIPNKALFKIHKRRATIIQVPGWLRRFFIHNQEMLDAPLSRVFIYDRTETWRQPVQLSFSAEEEAEGQQMLQKLGLEKGKYVCFHARDMRYAALRHGAMFKERGLEVGYLDTYSKFQCHRNMDFRDYFETINWLSRIGLKAVRIGADAEGSFQHPNLTDYAAIRESVSNPDLADIYILANCKLYVGQATGVTTSASALNVPGVAVNWFPYTANSRPTPMFKVCRIKHISYKGHQIDDMLASHMWDAMDWPRIYAASEQIDVINNTPQEILSSVKKAFELHERAAA